MPSSGISWQDHGNLHGQALNEFELLGPQGTKVRLPQSHQITGGHGRVQFELLLFVGFVGFVLNVLRPLGVQGFIRSGFSGVGGRLALGSGQHLREQLVRHLRVLEVGLKELMKHHAVFQPVDENTRQCCLEVCLLLKTNSQSRLERQGNLGAVHGHARTPECSGKAQEVDGPFADSSVTKLH